MSSPCQKTYSQLSFALMGRFNESDFAELIVDRRLLESFSNERSPYHSTQTPAPSLSPGGLQKLRSRLKWHISRSLSPRQREVIRMVLRGKREREIAEELGITQQVVNIYKWRAIKKLQKSLAS